MTSPPNRPAAPSSGEPEQGTPAVDAGVAGLAREVETLRRAVAPLVGLPDRVDEVADLITQLTTAVAALTERRSPTPCPSWLLAPTDPLLVEQLLTELVAWLHAVFLRYGDGAGGLPDCWLFHADIVEELIWLQHAWLAAYQGSNVSVALVGDWHDRQRPGVVRRIKSLYGSCSRERHQTRDGWDTAVSGAVEVPGMDQVVVIADWWATRRDETAPEPIDPQPAATSPAW